MSVSVAFDPTGMEGDIEKTVSVMFKPGPNFVRVFKANVRPRLILRPSDAAFGVVRRNDAERRIAAKLEGYVSSNAVITALLPPTNSFFDVQMKDSRTLEVGMRDIKALPGTYAENWVVRTSDGEIPEIKFPVSVRIADRFTVTPQVLTVGWNEATCSRLVSVRPERNDKGFKIVSAKTMPRPWGDVQIAQRPLGGWRVVVSHIEPASIRQFSKKPYLEITTDQGSSEPIQIPLRVEK